IKAQNVKEILPLMILMVMVFLMLLFWENELNEDEVGSSIEHLNVDYPQNAIPVRYCNHMILRRIIREPDHTCKKEHVFIHERPQKLNNICTASNKVTCRNHSTILCYQSTITFKMTVCQLTDGTKYPACRYRIAPPTEGFVLITCDELGPVNFQGYVL
ncbi:Hypothetical predicted protein, partial [Marmota monax]